MTSLAAHVADIGRLVDFAAEDDATAIEAAVLSVGVLARRRRPTALPPEVPSPSPAVVTAARAATLARELEVRERLVADSLSTGEVAQLLGITQPAVTKRRAARRLVAFRHRGDWRYPRWQFDGLGMLPGVVETWRALPEEGSADGLGDVRWFVLPSAHLGDRSPLAALQVGDAARVVDAASYVGSR